jgi:hypothetical protein
MTLRAQADPGTDRRLGLYADGCRVSPIARTLSTWGIAPMCRSGTRAIASDNRLLWRIRPSDALTIGAAADQIACLVARLC